MLLNNILKTLPSVTMSTRSLFVRNARTLEKLKTDGIPEEAYKHGQYLVFLKDSDSVLINSGTKALVWKNEQEVRPQGNSTENPLTILLDVVGQEPAQFLFAVDLPQGNGEEELAKELKGTFCNARKALFVLNSKESAMVSQARGLINFCRTTNYCKHCGGALTIKSAGTQKVCHGCSKTHYPTLSPVGIVMIEDPTHSKALLVRSARHPPGMYSCVAGFIEPGESLEASIRREIAEEVGLDVENIEYCASQHWAMPESQLMLGLLATATSIDFELDPIELEGGQWFDSDVIRDALDRAKGPAKDMNPSVLWVPPPSAVAHTLMESWLTKYHGYTPPIKCNI